MKALVYTQPSEVVYREESEPVPGRGDAMVQVSAVGICGSDVHAFLGHDERRVAPLILGHEASGVVIGGALDGERVVINPLVTCGECEDCRSGRSNICGSREIISMAPRQGAFAEFVSIPERNLVTLPAELDLTHAALAEPIATAWHAVAKAAALANRPLDAAKALVFGGGAVGLSAALSLHAQGCREIFLAETNASRRETASKASICTPFDPINEPVVGDNSIDVVIDCVGGRVTRVGSSSAIRPGGVIVHVGLLDRADGLDIRKLTLQEVMFCGSYTYTMEDFRAVVSAMSAGGLGNLDWYEERALADGPNAFSDLIDGRTGAAKIILRPNE